MRFQMILIAFPYLLTSASYAASYDCTKARGFVEKSICQNESLSQLDSALDILYTPTSDVESLRDKQRAFIKKRNECKTEVCLEDAYTARINSLSLELFGGDNPPPNHKKMLGQWQVADADQNSGANISIFDPKNNGFRFSFDIHSGANVRTTEGHAFFMNEHTAFYIDAVSDGIPCAIHFQFNGNKELTVFSNDQCDTQTGPGGLSFAKLTAHSKQNITTLTQAHLLPNRVLEKTLQELAGKNYQLFLDSIDVVSEPEEINGVTTRTSFVRGIANQQACIVITDGKTIWAAVLDSEHEQIRFYSNDEAKRLMVPRLIQKWINQTQPTWIVVRN